MDQKYLLKIKARDSAEIPETAAPVFRDRHNLLTEVEQLTEQHKCDAHNLSAMQTTLDQQAKNCENLLAAKDQQLATLKKALELACEEVTKHTNECPASLYGAEMCENCNDDDCDSNKADRWCDYFTQQAEQLMRETHGEAEK